MQNQQTLKSAIPCTGVGLHSGAKVSMTLRPAAADTGIVFRRTDVPAEAAEIPALWNRVVDTKLCTVLGNEHGVTVGTVEHLMAALRGCGIDNCVIELDGPEIPIMDGSAGPFVFLIESAGIVELAAPRRAIRVLKPVSVEDGEKSAAYHPAPVAGFNFEIDFASAAVSRQRGSFRLVSGSFKRELAQARTFGFLHEVEALRKMGLARGGSMENAIVISGDRVLNEGGLRFRDEFVRHKILDSVGDLYLAGHPIIGQFTGIRSGHALNNRLLHALFADSAAYRIETLSAESDGRAAGRSGTTQPVLAAG
ncbi:MAG TPA: UDP-3-O-acyl-N-acetylglucosamine deacetylase [Azospirillaceae bacterium]|nr:UDP-3-O-acyl-N-acetylglucosamine deacetylase [Azospirillaceae bacterium]